MQRDEGSGPQAAQTVLDVLRDIGKLGESLPYLKVAARILSTILKMKEELDACKDAWQDVVHRVGELCKALHHVQAHIATQPLPPHVQDGCRILQESLTEFHASLERYKSQKFINRMLRRQALHESARTCAGHLTQAVANCQLSLGMGTAVQVHETALQVHKIRGDMQALASTLGERALSARDSSRPPAFATRALPAASEFFTGRTADLARLESIFSSSARRIATLVTHGGAGKTQLALKFAQANSPNFSHVFFVDASSAESITAAYGPVTGSAHDNDPKSAVMTAFNYLSQLQTRWLLILDKADDPDLLLGQFIPPFAMAAILITSRNANIRHYASPSCHIMLLDLDEADAIQLFLCRAHAESSDDNCHLARDFIRTVGSLALAVTIASATIADGSYTLSDYVSRFKPAMLDNHVSDTLDGYTSSVGQALMPSIHKLSTCAQLLLQICSHLHHSAIPTSLFARAVKVANDQDALIPGERQAIHGTAWDIVQNFLTFVCSEHGAWDEHRFLQTVDELRKFSLISYSPVTKLISMHPLVQACASAKLGSAPDLNTACFLLLELGTQGGGTPFDLTLCHPLVPHTVKLWHSCIRVVLLHSSLGRIFSSVSLFSEALDVFEQQRDLCMKLLGDRHPETLSVMSSIAFLYARLDRHEDAERLGIQVLALGQQLLAGRHPDTLTAMSRLATTYTLLGKHQDAENLHMELLPLCREIMGAHHPKMIRVMFNAAYSYINLGRFKDAETLSLEVLALQRKLLGEHHPETLATWELLASTYAGLQRYKDAEATLVKVFAIRQTTLGAQHPGTLQNIFCRAIMYTQCGRHVDAEKLHKEVLASQREILGDRHPDTLSSMSCLAATYTALNRHVDAATLYVEAVTLQRVILGEHHPKTLAIMFNTALAYFHLGQYTDSERLNVALLAHWRAHLGDRHLSTLSSMELRALNASKCHRLQDARELFLDVLKLRKEVNGPTHPETLRVKAQVEQIERTLGTGTLLKIAVKKWFSS